MLPCNNKQQLRYCDMHTDRKYCLIKTINKLLLLVEVLLPFVINNEIITIILLLLTNCCYRLLLSYLDSTNVEILVQL